MSTEKKVETTANSLLDKTTLLALTEIEHDEYDSFDSADELDSISECGIDQHFNQLVEDKAAIYISLRISAASAWF